MKILRHSPILLALALAAAAVAYATSSVMGSHAQPDGPVDVVWDHEICAQCRMHIGEPAFAAQVQTEDGAVLSFDDPGCAVLYLGDHSPAVHAMYFRHHREPRWLPNAEAAFVKVTQSPMGYGYGAVEAGVPESEPFSVVRNRIEETIPR